MSYSFFHHKSPVPLNTPATPMMFKKRSECWQLVEEVISACGSETYPVDPAIVAAIRKFEPDFCPVWITTVYQSPAGTIHKFGRHGIAKDYRFYDPDEKLQPFRVWTSCHGLNAGRRPVLITGILGHDEGPKVHPDLNVYGYQPLTWQHYYNARRDNFERTNRRRTQESDEARGIRMAQEHLEHNAALDKKKLDFVNAEADYGFDHDTRGKLDGFRDTLFSHSGFREMHQPVRRERKPFLHMQKGLK